MKPDAQFLNLDKNFWANVRTISQELGYTQRGGMKNIKIPTLAEVKIKFEQLTLDTHHICNNQDELTEFGAKLFAYFEYRARVLNKDVQSLLMNKDSAEIAFKEIMFRFGEKEHNCPLPMNKQKGEKRNYAFLTCIVNLLIEEGLSGLDCNFDPRGLTTITDNRQPIRTLARRVDGAFPSIVNPIAIWEIKEYYYTTTFGSRVADGVYETLLDGMELEELYTSTNRKVQHLLVIDDYFTWWKSGRSYLCRMIDMLHMGYVDEIIFGREALTRIPEIAQEWRDLYMGEKLTEVQLD